MHGAAQPQSQTGPATLAVEDAHHRVRHDRQKKGNIRVLMTKNFILKKRMYQKLSGGFCPVLLFMELILPPVMLLGLTIVKMEAPLYMKLSGYGGWPICNENEKHPCTQETPIECTAGQFGEMDVVDAAARAGIAGAKNMADSEVQTVVSTCESVSEFVFQPDPFFFTLAALHWAQDGGPKIALTASDPADIPKVRRFQQWVTQHWYPEQIMAEIPCVDLEIRDKGNLWRADRDRAERAEFGQYRHCANEVGIVTDDHAKTCWCDGRVRIGRQGHWSAWQNSTGWIECSQDVFGDPWPDVDYEDETGHNPTNDDMYCVCDDTWPVTVPDRDPNEWIPRGCSVDKCLDHGQDCCAPQAIHEVAHCSDGYQVKWIHQSCAGMQGEGWYQCCPPEPGSQGPGACHFMDAEERGGMMSSFTQVTKIYESSAAMNAHMRSEDYGAANLWGYDILAAIIFHKIPGDGSPGAPGEWDYTLMVNDSAAWGVVFERNVSRGWKYYEDLDEHAVRYDQSRYLTLQTLVDRYVIHKRNSDPNFDSDRALEAMFATSLRKGKQPWAPDWDRGSVNKTYLVEPLMWSPQFVQFAPLPVMGFHITLFYYYCDFALALLFILMFLDTMYTVVSTFISEKETRMREVLRIQGVTTFEFLASWGISYSIQFAGLNLMVTLVAVFPPIRWGTDDFGGIFSESGTPIVFLFFFLYSMAFVAKGFTISTFFSKARTGGMISCIIYLAGWFIQAALKYQPSSSTAKALLSFFSPVGCFAFGIELFQKLEESGAGGRLDTLEFQPEGANSLCLAWVMQLMLGQAAFYCVIGWYFDQVLPSQWGVKEKPWFVFLPSYWRPTAATVSTHQPHQAETVENPVSFTHLENDSAEMQQQLRDNKCINIRRLRKVFPTPDGEFVAVNNLEMAMYEGQIFSLLGHNGAGKTTTISMLTGMLSPSAGDAYVYGKSVVLDMPSVRQDIGFCPQHDVLYPSLTVCEHLRMFGLLKGITEVEIDKVVMAKIADVGLTEKVKVPSGSLSGGQKRKLSLAMALIGECKAVFLDEPTSGMDPYSRRSTWNMLQAARAGRVMVLTTHFMDEADILGDRIGIMAHGQLCCCGSSLFLKAQFGGGYNLAFAKTSTDEATALQRAVTTQVPGCKIISNIGTELKCQLPLAELHAFPELFSDLEAKQQQYGFESYGIGITTMEEVFLRVAENGAIDSVARREADEESAKPGADGLALKCCQHIFAKWTAQPAFKNGDPRCYSCGASFIKHLVAMYIKRARYGFRDRKAQICNIVTPILLLWFGFFLMYDVLGGLIERPFPELKLSLDMIKDELHLDSLKVPLNSTYPGERPEVTRFPGGLFILPENVELGPEERELFGVVYTNGKPVGDSDQCMMEPRQMISFSKQLYDEGMGSTGANVVYGAVMFPAEPANCCGDFQIPCGQVQSILVTGLGLTCTTQLHELASPNGYGFLHEHLRGRESAIARLLGLQGGDAPQQLDNYLQQGADAVTIMITIARMLGVSELADATLGNFCPAQCSDTALQHWNTRASLKALIANRYQPCVFAMRAMDNANAIVNVLRSLSFLETSEVPFLTCETTPIQLFQRLQPIMMALQQCVDSSMPRLCSAPIDAALSVSGIDANTEQLIVLLDRMNQTAGIMAAVGLADASLSQVCLESCGHCNKTLTAESSISSSKNAHSATTSDRLPASVPAQSSVPPVRYSDSGQLPSMVMPSPPPTPMPLPICIDDPTECSSTANGICDEYNVGAPCDVDHSCSCPINSDATDCAAVRQDCVLSGRGRRAQHAYESTPLNMLTILYNASFTHATPVFLSLGDNYLKQKNGGGSITARITECPWTHWQKYSSDVSVIIGLFQSLVVCLFVIIAFSFVPGALVEFSVREREHNRNAKHQQYVCGASIPAYWIAAYLWDLTCTIAPVAATLFLAAWFSVDPLVRGDAQWCCFVLFWGYALAICPFTYLMGHLFSSSAKAQIYTILFNLMTGVVLMVASYILNQFYKTHDVNEVLMWFYRIFPGFCVGHGLLQIFINNNEVTASLASVITGTAASNEELSMFQWEVAGKDLLYLYMSAIVYMSIVLAYDFVKAYPALAKRINDLLPCGHIDAVKSVASQIVFDEDVACEAERVMRGDADDDLVKLSNLQKVYPGGKMAVKSISLGIPLGECFGLLGINGAGKTSTLKVLSGDQLPTAGTAHVGGMNVLENQRAVRQLIGYCPQFDALLDLLTVREHLELFSRIKNVSECDLGSTVDAALDRMDLMRYANKLAGALSGGNKRKLCVAMAIMGQPKVVFLDEPSTGVDPVARRFMWDIISDVCTGQRETTIILTSHNMEECEALCTRIGIMVGGYMRCLGSITHLRARFGQGYQLEVKLRYPVPEVISAIAATRGVPMPAVVRKEDVQRLCADFGSPGLAATVCPDSEKGSSLYHALQVDGSVSDEFFLGWFILQQYTEALNKFVKQAFAGSMLIEQHEQNFRFNIPQQGWTLSQIFGKIEDARQGNASADANFDIEHYAINQTTLEQVFNQFAAQQEEETVPIRGMGGAASIA